MNVLLALLLTFSAGAKHDFHVSITNGEYNPKTETLQIYLKLFSDDLQNAIEDDSGKASSAPSDSLVKKFVLDHFWLKINNEKLKPKYIGKELEQDITFIYLEVPFDITEKAITVSNTVFFDRFDDQSNIVNLEINGQLKSAFLDEGTPAETLHFD